jgi:ubiquinone/menaquinone biosynthesis C-methylase UbiE
MNQYKPYEKLAQIYDRLMEHVDYGMWSNYINRLICGAGTQVRSVADLACGTGNFLTHLRSRFPIMYGCDLAEAMIREARIKKELKGIPLFICDLQSIAMQDAKVDAAILLYDSLNYLVDEVALQKSLSEIHRILKPDGLFLFDIISQEHCLNYFADYHENEYWENEGYSRHSFFDQKKGIQHNHFRIIIDGFTYLEKHIQRIYKTDFLLDILNRCSFLTLKIFEEFSFEEANDSSGRMHFLCQKI